MPLSFIWGILVCDFSIFGTSNGYWGAKDTNLKPYMRVKISRPWPFITFLLTSSAGQKGSQTITGQKPKSNSCLFAAFLLPVTGHSTGRSCLSCVGAYRHFREPANVIGQMEARLWPSSKYLSQKRLDLWVQSCKVLSLYIQTGFLHASGLART